MLSKKMFVIVVLSLFSMPLSIIAQLRVSDTVDIGICKAAPGGFPMSYQGVITLYNESETDTIDVIHNISGSFDLPKIGTFNHGFAGIPFRGSPYISILPKDSRRLSLAFTTGDANDLEKDTTVFAYSLKFIYRAGLNAPEQETNTCRIIARAVSGAGEIITQPNWFYKDVRSCSSTDFPGLISTHMKLGNGTPFSIALDSVTFNSSARAVLSNSRIGVRLWEGGEQQIITFPHIINPEAGVTLIVDVFPIDNGETSDTLSWHYTLNGEKFERKEVVSVGQRVFPQPGRLFQQWGSNSAMERIGNKPRAVNLELQLCTPGEWSIDSLRFDGEWLPEEFSLAENSLPIPSFVDGAFIYSIPAFFTAKKIDTVQGFIRAYCTDPSGNQHVFSHFYETLVRGALVSVEENYQTSAYKLYPNPATDRLHIQAPEIGVGTAFSVVNSLGATVQQGSLLSEKTTLSVAGLPAGAYFVVIERPSGRVALPFVITP